MKQRARAEVLSLVSSKCGKKASVAGVIEGAGEVRWERMAGANSCWALMAMTEFESILCVYGKPSEG